MAWSVQLRLAEAQTAVDTVGLGIRITEPAVGQV
jgi:hypothetical protein